jgi:hypothetical protein
VRCLKNSNGPSGAPMDRLVRCLKNSNEPSCYLKAVGSFNNSATIRSAIHSVPAEHYSSSQDRAIAYGHCIMSLRKNASAVPLREHKNWAIVLFQDSHLMSYHIKKRIWHQRSSRHTSESRHGTAVE